MIALQLVFTLAFYFAAVYVLRLALGALFDPMAYHLSWEHAVMGGCGVLLGLLLLVAGCLTLASALRAWL